MRPEPESERLIVRCLDCNEEWDMDADPPKCTNPSHHQSLNGGDPVDAHGFPVTR